jgi:hypothetical protein
VNQAESLLLLFHLAVTLLMTGILWFVQVVHYPLFQAVPAASFVGYEQLHTSRTGLLVAPLMLAELATAAALAFLAWGQEAGAQRDAFAGNDAPLLFLNLVLLTVLWAVTFLVQVPHHEALSKGFDAARIQSLVDGNWLRTLLWSARAALLLKIFWDRFLLPRISLT